MGRKRKSAKRATVTAAPVEPLAPAAPPPDSALPPRRAAAWRERLMGMDLRPAVWMLLAAGLLLGLGLHVVHVFTSDPNFDEHLHLHFLWQTSVGILPRDHFLCPYPPTAYYLLAPLMRLLPAEPEIFLHLRVLTLLPFAAFVAAAAWLARRCQRPALPAALWVLTALTSGQLPAFWEIRFDVLAWALAWGALGLLLGPVRRPAMTLAAGLATLSVLLAPKHALAMGGVAMGFACHRLLQAPRRFPGDALAALAGALVPIGLLTLLRPTFLADAWDLSLMNIRSQAGSKYPIEFLEAVLNLMIGHPIIALPMWAGPVLFLLQARALPPQHRWLLGGLLAGSLATIATLPCGYTQYVSLAWALFVPFLPWLLPAGRPGFGTVALLSVLLLHLSWYAGRDHVLLHGESTLTKQIRLQHVLARICPPGELDSATPFGHTWCRESPGYVFTDNKPSYRHSVRPERLPVFTEEYYLQRLRERPPAFDLPFTTTDGQPEGYRQARRRFLDEQSNRYVLGWIPYDGHAALRDRRLHLYIRRDRVPYAEGFVPMDGKLIF